MTILDNINRTINYKLAKFYYKRDKSNLKLTETQLNITRIYRNLLAKSDSEMLVAPLSGKKYIKWQDITAIVAYGSIIVASKDYYYSVDLPDKIIKKLERQFDFKVEKRRSNMENKLQNRVNHSLHSILHLIQENKVS